MTPERWQRIEELYHDALACPAHARAAWLASACGDDAELRREIELLLAANDEAGSFIAGYALEHEAQKLAVVPTVRVGQQISRYRIVAQLGAGGMGEVWVAEDTSLSRRVAVKLLPAGFTANAELVRRFEQEARATSALNHPNILTIYDFGTHAGAPYLVAELLEGAELRVHLKAGALPLRQTLDYALQITHGLVAAHEHGITHRDLKPENLFIMSDGRVKILDFGLAKLKPPKLAGRAHSETPTLPHTDPGTVMGTVGYMSPEQVRGQEADQRSDIFSFGLILYEMLTGRQAFQAESPAETLAAIVQQEPPEITETNSQTPPQLVRIVQHCLEKRPERRFQTARDLAFALEALSAPIDAWPAGARLLAAGPATKPSVPVVAPAGRGWLGRGWLAWLTAAAFALIAAALGLAHWWRPTPAPAVLRFQVNAPEGTRIEQFALSPDGTRMLFIAGDPPGIWVRSFAALAAKPLAGTEDARYPFWSSDGAWIGFFRTGKLRKIAQTGGPVQELADAPNPRGGAWGRDGVIVYAPDRSGPLYRVSAAGGAAQVCTKADEANNESSHRWPYFLPDGRVLYLNRSSTKGSSLWLATLAGRASKRLLEAESNVGFIPAPDGQTGHLLYVLETALLARKFDLGSGELAGEPQVVATPIIADFSPRYAFATSESGALAYQSGQSLVTSQLIWLDRAGRKITNAGLPGVLANPLLSPDGKLIVIQKFQTPVTGTTCDIWLQDSSQDAQGQAAQGQAAQGQAAQGQAAQGQAATRLTFDGPWEINPVWSPDGARLAYMVGRPGGNLYLSKFANGAGPEETLPAPPNLSQVTDWSRTGHLLYAELSGGGQDLWTAEARPGGTARRYLEAPLIQRGGRFSPDGKWVAYASNESRRFEIFVQSFPQAEQARWQVSTNGGQEPVWRRDGRELFYLAPDGKLMAVEVRTRAEGLEFAAPQALFETGLTATPNGRSFDAAPDGQRFLTSVVTEKAPEPPLNVVLNWVAELKN